MIEKTRLTYPVRSYPVFVNRQHFGEPSIEIVRNVTGMMKTSLRLASGEKLLVITDPRMSHLGDAFLRGGRIWGATAEKFTLDPQSRPLQEIPSDLKKVLERGGYHAVINIFEDLRQSGQKPGEGPFRVALTGLEEKLGLKTGHSPAVPGIIEQIMSTPVDYPTLLSNAKSIIETTENSKAVKITTPDGTDLSFSVEGRRFTTDMVVSSEMQMVNLPPGEVLCAPVEDSANGVLVIPTDGLIHNLGNPKSPITVKFSGGKIVDISGNDTDIIARFKAQLIDEMAWWIGEFGIGLRYDFKKFFGHMLPDEKRGGTIHIAVGNNTDFGGNNNSAAHHDLLIPRPTYWAIYHDGTELPIIENGKSIYIK